MEQEEKLCDEVETVRELAYLSDRVSAGGGCEEAVTARTSCGWGKLRECGEFLYGRRFPPKLKCAVYKSYVRPAIQYGSEASCLRENAMGILQRTERSTVRAMCAAERQKKISGFDVGFE